MKQTIIRVAIIFHRHSCLFANLEMKLDNFSKEVI